MMYKYDIIQLPKPISKLFSVNINVHNHNTRSVVIFALQLLGVKLPIAHLVIEVVNCHIWNHISQN